MIRRNKISLLVVPPLACAHGVSNGWRDSNPQAGACNSWLASPLDLRVPFWDRPKRGPCATQVF